jgi:predicted 3-demethylubiquinone-9 3-methyltransferase (glyoxalase superfamily)
MQSINPFLWFNDQAEEAARFYVSVFKNSQITQTVPYPKSAENMGAKAGSVMTVTFMLNGQKFTAINGGPHFEFTPAISFVVPCDTQEEIDDVWGKLSADPAAEQCGWLKDKFGVSWQIIPTALSEMLTVPEKAEKVMAEVMKMKKIDIATLQKAA